MRTLVCLIALAGCTTGDDDSVGAGGDAGSGDVDAPSNNGTVSLMSYSATGGGSGTVVGGSAAAYFQLPRTGNDACTEQRFGDCRVIACPTTSWTPTYVSGGTITVMGLSAPITLVPRVDKTYEPFSSDGHMLFAGGETVTIKGTGADVPAFTLSVTLPSRPSITSPTKPAGNGALTINRAQDFSVAWSGGTGKLYAFVGNPAGAAGGTLYCEFDAAAGTGTIPSGALARLSPGMGSFGAYSYVRTSVDVADWRVYGGANFQAVWASDGSFAGANATVQ